MTRLELATPQRVHESTEPSVLPPIFNCWWYNQLKHSTKCVLTALQPWFMNSTNLWTTAWSHWYIMLKEGGVINSNSKIENDHLQRIRRSYKFKSYIGDISTELLNSIGKELCFDPKLRDGRISWVIFGKRILKLRLLFVRVLASRDCLTPFIYVCVPPKRRFSSRV